MKLCDFCGDYKLSKSIYIVYLRTIVVIRNSPDFACEMRFVDALLFFIRTQMRKCAQRHALSFAINLINMLLEYENKFSRTGTSE